MSGGPRTLTTTNTASDNTTNGTTSGITFSGTTSTINSETGQNHNLNLAMTSGTATLDGAVGGTRALGAIAITGNLDLNAAIAGASSSAGATSLTVSGSSDLGANVTTSGAQTYTGAVTVSADSVVTANSITMPTLALQLGSTGHQLIVTNTDAASSITGQISGTGALVKRGTGTLTLSGPNNYTGSTTVNAGTLRAGSTTAFGSNSAVTLADVTSTVLDLNGNDISIGSLAGGGNIGGTVVLGNKTLTTGGNNTSTNFAGAINGTGGNITKVGSGTLTLSGNNSYTGGTTINAGTLAITHNNALGGTGAGGGTTVNSNTALDLRGVAVGEEAITLNGGTLATSFGASIISGTVNLGANANFSVSGSSLNMTGAVNGPYALAVTGSGALTLAGSVGQTTALTSLNAAGPLTLASNVTTTGAQTYTGAVTVSGGNRMLTGSAITANNMNTPSDSSLSLTATGTVDISAGNLPLTLGSVTAGAGGSIRAGTVQLNDQMTVSSGTLTLLASADASGNTTNSNKLSPTQTSLYYSADVVTQGTNGKIDLLQGARLVVLAPGNSANGGVGGSVALTHADNSFAGELEILSGAANATWSAHLGNGQSVQGRVQVNGSGVRIGGAGIKADIVSVRANQLSTLGHTVITARMPFNNAMEASATVPGLTLALAPAAFSLASPFGRTGAEIAVNVGYGSSFNTGLVSALPQNGAQGATAVVLKGPAVGNGYTFYSTNAGIQSEIPVYYNGLMPSTPEVSGAISATISVIENARRQGFEEALRTENVATRLRSGVIAEVGPGRSATTGSQGIALPSMGDTDNNTGEEK